MGAPSSDMEAAEQPAAENLLGAFKTIGASDRGTHASVLNYWLSIRGDKEFPSLHDLDPLKLSDAAPNSILLELISGGHDAEIRHIGQALKAHGEAERLIDAPRPSILACIANKLPIVAISRDFLAFEDEFSSADGTTRCWVTLLPLSAGGAWVDYVYALVSFDGAPAKAAGAAKAPAKKARVPEAQAEEPKTDEAKVEELPEPSETEPVAAAAPEPVADAEPAVDEAVEPVEPIEEPEPEPVEAEVEAEPGPEPEPVEAEVEPEPEPEPVEATVAPESTEPAAEAPAEPAPKAGFSKLIAGLTGFYGSGYKFEPLPAEAEVERPAIEEPAAEALPEEPIELEEIVDEVTVEEAPQAEEPLAEAPTADDTPVEEPVGAEPPVEELALEEPAAAPEPEPEPAEVMEGTLQSKLTEVRAKADEARQAKLRANAALYEGLGAAYDFALDAEDAPEEYLRLVEAQGLKIQLRSPMKPVVKLAFDGLCDDMTIRQLEAVLAWALDNELPRGSLAEQIEAAGGIARILTGDAKAA